MPNDCPVYDPQNSANDTSNPCCQRMEEYERQMTQNDLHGKLAAAENEISAGAVGENFLTIAKRMRKSIHGTV